MGPFVSHKGNFSSTLNTNRLHSGNVWCEAPIDAIQSGFRNGYYFFDDFGSGGIITAPTTQAALVGNGWSGFSSSAAQISYDDSEDGGIVLAETTDNEGTVINQEPHPFVISNVSGNFCFEARIKLSHTATTENSWVAGLMDTTAVTATVPLTAAGAIADVNFVGFHKPEANTTAFDASYKANGVTLVEVNSDVGAITAATYFKVGMKKLATDNILRFYVDGLQLASTKTITGALGTDFPSDIGLGIVLGLAVGAAASDNTMTIDWVGAAKWI